MLRVLYLIFNEGYSGRVDLSAEAIRLTRQLALACDEPEVAGLLALMLLHDARRGVLLRNAVGVELLLLLGALLLVALGRGTPGSARQAVVVVAAALAMGVQNAVARRLSVPDLTTTVLTMTLTGIAADLREASRTTLVRRLLAVAAMLLGAAAGALLVLHIGVEAGLAASTGVVAAVLAGAGLTSRSAEAWSSGRT